MTRYDAFIASLRRERHFGDRLLLCPPERLRNLHDYLARSVAARPDAAVLVTEETAVTYRQLDEQVRRLAAALAARGVGRGDRVALLIGNRPAFVAGLFAAARLGAVAVPIGMRLKRPELLYILQHSGSRALLFESAKAGDLPGAPELPELALRIAVDAPAPGALLLDEMLAGADIADLPPPAAVDEEDIAALMYTSGTTGLPKGAEITHFNFCTMGEQTAARFDLGPEDCGIAGAPLSHITGLVAVLLALIHAGGRVALQREFEPAGFLALCQRAGVSFTFVVPAIYNLCLLKTDMRAYDLSRWRIGGFGGAPMPEATIAGLAKAVPSMTLVNGYGATETTTGIAMTPPEGIRGNEDTVGKALALAEILIMDDEGREVPRGTPGELWVRAASTVRGYRNNPEATAASFVSGFWRSGDIGSVDASGFVRLHDRLKDMINRGGYKVFSVEVENVLAGHPEVAEVAIVASPCPVLGERVHAFVTPRTGTPTLDSLRAWAAERLADYKLPDFLTLQPDGLPRNANGKVQKQELRKLAG